MRALVLGGNGQVGRELQQRLAPHETVVATRAEADFAKPDVLAALVERVAPQVVFNAAAYTAVDAAETDADTAHLVNARAPAALAQACARRGCLLVHYSTDYVFDGTASVPYREQDPPRPVSAYGRSKLAGEEAVRDSGCRHLILRTAWVYASHGKNFLLTMLRLARERPELRVVADQVGGPTWAAALADASVRAAQARLMPASGASGTYHATGGGTVSWHGFAEAIVERGAALGLCRRVPVRAIGTADYPTPAKRPAWSVLDNGKLQRDFGIALPPWREQLDGCLAELARQAAA